MAFITTIYWHTLVDKLNEATVSIHLVLPSIDEELAQCLLTIQAEKKVTIKVCIDNSEEAIRNGYGEAQGIGNLIKNNISVKERKGNRVSFVIIDTNGYLLFPESRIFSEKPTGPNAIELDAFTATRLIAHYFPSENEQQKVDILNKLSEAFDRSEKWIDKVSDEIDKGVVPISSIFKKDEFEKTKKALEKNPPVAPDLQRKIKTYNTKIQFVELKFSGINLHARTINIPKDAVPINNPELKKLLLTKMKLFQNVDDNKSFQVFSQLKRKVDALRTDYLKPITCREGKSILQVELKGAFNGRLEKIKAEIQELNQHLPDIIETSLSEIREVFSNELFKLYSEPQNFPKHLEKYQDKVIRTDKLKGHINYLVEAIFHKVAKQAETICLQEFYYDLTFQDFSDEKLLQELQKKDIMMDEDVKGIVEMKNAFAEKK